jgi:hypothetical protein
MRCISEGTVTPWRSAASRRAGAKRTVTVWRVLWGNGDPVVMSRIDGGPVPSCRVPLTLICLTGEN